MKKIPDPITPEGYFIPTLNQTGFMSAWVSDEFMKAFIEFAPNAPGLCLDVGAAYGVATIAALRAGAKIVANDSSMKHLEILRDQVPEKIRGHLTLAPGIFPSEISFDPATLGGILIARVLHFLDGAQIREALQKCFEWMKPGAKLFITAETPYLRNILSFVPEYESRVAAGSEWPGWVDDFRKWDTRAGLNLPEKMHLLDEAVLTRELKNAGFNILKISKFARPEFPSDLQLDGRESVGAIAEKL